MEGRKWVGKSLMFILAAVFFVFTIILASAFFTTSNLSVTGLGISELSAGWFFSGSESVRLYAPLITDFIDPLNWHEARVNITFDIPMQLTDLNNISWQTNVIQGYLPHADIFLDLDSDGISDDVLVFEYAKVDPFLCDNAPYPIGILDTFGNKGILDDNSYAWLNSGVPGPCGNPTFDNNHKSLSDWKIFYPSAEILRIQIEVDGWIETSEAYVDDTVINGQIVELFDEVFPSLNSTTISGTYFNGTNYYFSPANQDGIFDNATITMNVSELVIFPQSIPRGIEIINSTGEVIKYFFQTSSFNVTTIKVWDGTSPEYAGDIVPDGIYTINITMEDSAGNKNTTTLPDFIFVDNTPPIITLLGNSTETVEINSSYTDAGTSVFDAVDGNLTSNIIINNSVNTSILGIYTVTYDITDSVGNVANQETRTVNVVDSIIPTITLLGENPQIMKLGDPYVEFGATAFDGIDGNLTSQIQITNNININSVGTYNVSYDVMDLSGNAANQETRTIIVADKPIMDSFTGGSTTNLSDANLSSVSNFTLENPAGKIVFSETVDLTNVLDIDGSVIMQNGIIAINSTKYPELNKNATITLSGISYNSVPDIFYTDEFTGNPGEINQVCDFCTLLNYTNFPTTNGVVVFETEHFSSFLVGNSGNPVDLDSLTNVARCLSGEIGNITIGLNNPDEDEEIAPGEIFEINADVENENQENKKIIFKAILYDLDENDEEEKAQKSKTVSGGDEKEFEINLEVSDKIDDGNRYVLYVKAYEENNQQEQCSEGAIPVEIKREKHEVKISNFVVNPEIIYPDGILDIFIQGQNVGSEDEESVYLTIRIPNLEILESSGIFSLEEFDENDRFEKNFQIRIPRNAEPGNYQIIAKVNFEDGSNEEIQDFAIFKKITLNYPSGETGNNYPREITNTHQTNSVAGNAVQGNSYEDDNFMKLSAYLMIANLLMVTLILLVVVLRRR